MPGSTPDYDFPYAIGGDPVGDGEDSIQALAEAIEDHLQGCTARLARSSKQNFTMSIGGTIAWTPASSTLSPEFSWGAGNESIIYTGPDRWVAFQWVLEWDSVDSGVAFATFVKATGFTYDTGKLWQLGAAPGNGWWNDSGMVWMTNGSEWELTCVPNDAGLSDDDVTPTLFLKGL